MTFTAAERQLRYRARHPERVKAYWKEHRAKPEVKARTAVYNASDNARTGRKRYYENNKDYFREAGRKNVARRRARKAGSTVYWISEKDMRRLLANSCVACSGSGQHIDHIIPISRGGQHSIGNLQMLCAWCNMSKKDKVMTEWRAYRALVAA